MLKFATFYIAILIQQRHDNKIAKLQLFYWITAARIVFVATKYGTLSNYWIKHHIVFRTHSSSYLKADIQLPKTWYEGKVYKCYRKMKSKANLFLLNLKEKPTNIYKIWRQKPTYLHKITFPNFKNKSQLSSSKLEGKSQLTSIKSETNSLFVDRI